MKKELRTKLHPKIFTKNQDGSINGYLVPIYNINDKFFKPGQEPQQVYLTVIAPGQKKGPHLHFIRTGFFTCIRGNIKIIVKIDNEYREYFSGESYEYRSVEIPTGVPALLYNIGEEDAFILNMPNPAWMPNMNDEFTADFSDYNVSQTNKSRV
jgi:dTDP-4-dehydrorhamnose 3,5-epimerase